MVIVRLRLGVIMQRYKDDYMNTIMTPPEQDEVKYNMYVPQVSTMKLISNGHGLGDVPLMNVGGSNEHRSENPHSSRRRR